MLNKRKLVIFGVLALVIAVIVLAAFKFTSGNDQQYFTSPIAKGDIRQVVDATGTINAVTTVQVGSQVSGTINKLHADFNSHVKAGQVIAELDPSLFQGAMLQASADLENAKANLAAAKANLEKARANAAQTSADYKRNEGLAQAGVVSQQQLDLAKATAESNEAAVSAAQSAVTQAAAQVQQKTAALQVAKTNLGYTIIKSPIDGVVVARNVDVGQTVAASLQAPTLFTIAQDLTKMQVYAATDESDVGMIRPGQRVSFKVDAFPNDTFYGEVLQIRMNPTTVQNVVTYNTIVNFDNPELKLFPGMTAYITIPVAQAKDTLKIPNGALRYKPDMKPDEVKALYAKFGIDPNMPGSVDRQPGQGGGQRGAGGGQSGAGDAGMGRGGQRGGGAGAPQQTGQQQGGGNGMPQMRERRQDVAVVWKLMPDKSVQPVQVRTGITDHTVTALVEVLHGDLKEGDELVTGSAKASGGSGANRAPGAPGAMRR